MTIATQPKQKLTFDQFLEQYPEDGHYELIDGELVRKLATRRHENVAELIEDALKDEVRRLKLNYKVSGRIVLATTTKTGVEQGRHPDVSVVDKTLWDSKPSAYTALREPIQLAVEVVSTNWEDDYIDKLDEYQRLGIIEYWMVDYLAIGSREYLGNPKEPAVFVYTLTKEGIYQQNRFQGGSRIVSATFPELSLTVEQILEA
jgi:Uma2 family endonuclease